MTVRELHDADVRPQLLDVRSPVEWQKGHIPGATHIFAPEIRGKAARQLDKDGPVAVYCGSGYRASIAASILQQEGFLHVRNVPGSWQAWKHAGYETEGGGAG